MLWAHYGILERVMGYKVPDVTLGNVGMSIQGGVIIGRIPIYMIFSQNKMRDDLGLIL